MPCALGYNVSEAHKGCIGTEGRMKDIQYDGNGAHEAKEHERGEDLNVESVVVRGGTRVRAGFSEARAAKMILQSCVQTHATNSK